MFRSPIHLLPKKIIQKLKRLINGYALESYSQEGEDMILRRIFEKQRSGFYVDVGAHHPMRFSNTYFFYKAGWHGINIDAMPGSMKSFRKYRPRDINIEVPVSLESKELTYYVFNEPALNGFDPRLSRERNSKDNLYKIQKTITLQTQTLCTLLDEHLPANQKINFLSIDVEGLDLEVLRSNDWNKYSPEIVLVEVLRSSLSGIEASDVNQFMVCQGYEPYAKAVNTVIYRKRLPDSASNR